MINFIKKNGKVTSVKSINELFTGTNHKKIRHELFGSSLCKTYDVVKVQSNAEKNIKEVENQLVNLRLLLDELKKQQAEKETQELMSKVEKVDERQIHALLEKLNARLAKS